MVIGGLANLALWCLVVGSFESLRAHADAVGATLAPLWHGLRCCVLHEKTPQHPKGPMTQTELKMDELLEADGKPLALACRYQHGTWECRGDGYLWDADSDGYGPHDVSHACPGCNTRQFLLDKKKSAESISDGENIFWSFTGETLWLGAIDHAVAANPEATDAALAEIGFVDALRPARNTNGFETVRYVYPPAGNGGQS
jgi:hypothetical protein